MRNREGHRRARPRIGSAAALALVVAGAGTCTSNPVPVAKRITPEQAITSGKGAYAVITFEDGARVAGELMAVSNDTIWLQPDGAALAAYTLNSVSSVVLGVHDNHFQAMMIWTMVGSLSTVSHGAALVFTLPMWLLTGIPVSLAESHRGILQYPAAQGSPTAAAVGEMKAYARFPQGLPPGVRAPQPLTMGPPPGPDRIRAAMKKINAGPE